MAIARVRIVPKSTVLVVDSEEDEIAVPKKCKCMVGGEDLEVEILMKKEKVETVRVKGTREKEKGKSCNWETFMSSLCISYFSFLFLIHFLHSCMSVLPLSACTLLPG
jgi:hypothetical protein